MNSKNAKTKILVTIGPASDSVDSMGALVDAGADAFRLNFSHGTYEYFDKVYETIHEVCTARRLPIPVLMDLQGPKIRVGELIDPEIELVTGDTIDITTEYVVGTSRKISTSYDLLARDANVGDKILIDDGLIHLEVKSKDDKTVTCLITAGGTLKPRKGMNLPGMKLSTPALTDKDLRDLEYGLSKRVDYIALSFVRSAEDILQLKRILSEKGREIPVIAKIEKPEACDNLDEILEVSDGIMVARGDLGVEMEPQEVPIIQKRIIKKCKATGKLVITATQMLESMIHNPVPTRAEASDVANAVFDGTDVVMLSGETSVGKFAVRAVSVMNDILLRAEGDKNDNHKFDYIAPDELESNLFDAMGKAIATVGDQVGAAYIVVVTRTGRMARVVSKFRPKTEIVALANNFDILNRLNLRYGVTPFYMKENSDDEETFDAGIKVLKKRMNVKKGDVILFTWGDPFGKVTTRNSIRFIVVD